MKVLAVLLIATIGNVAAFVTPNNHHYCRQSSKIAATAELDGLVGVDIESGKKIVRHGIKERIFFGMNRKCG